MDEPEASPNPNPNKSSLCEECGLNPWKYRCPGCSIRSCSLPCVKSHKQRTNCTGKRSRTEFVPLSQFDDNLLISDYNLLEETKRVAESARRIRDGFPTNFGFKLPPRFRLLRNAANRRRTHMLLLPAGMSRKEKNQSRYDQRKKSIFWTIEWKFHSTDVVLIDHGVDEHMSLYFVIEKHLKPGPWNHQLRPYCNLQLDDLKFFLQKNPKGPMSPFRELNIKAPFGQQLTNVVILEYPIIHVFLPSHRFDFEVEKDARSFPRNDKPPDSFDNKPSPRGILFREEEMEENEVSSDTQVTDLMDCMRSELFKSFQIPEDVTLGEKADNLSDMQMSKAAAEVSSKPHVVGKARRYSNDGDDSIKLSEDTKFDFEQDLRVAYSDSIGEINPDDFLCLDGGYSYEGELKERRGNQLVLGEGLLGEEELEEGEIPSY